jgi:hypothetical protein
MPGKSTHLERPAYVFTVSMIHSVIVRSSRSYSKTESTFSTITLLALQGVPFSYRLSKIDPSVRNLPGLLCQGCDRFVPK